MKSIQEKRKIYKFLIQLKIEFYLTSPQISHLVNFVLSCLNLSFKGKVVEVSQLYTNKRHRTSISRFFTDSKWLEDLVLNAFKRYHISKLSEICIITGKPIEIIIDDTISKKAKPRSKALNTIKNCKYHHSHTERKKVYGHQIVVAILKCGRTTLPYHMSVYNKEIESKISIAVSIISELKENVGIKYVLADSWYSSEKVIKATIKAGYTYIGALRINRKIYPFCKKDGLQIREFASNLRKKSFNLVTVRGNKYYTFRYCGKINGFNKVVIIISYPKDKFGQLKALKAFICTDTIKSTTEILHIYSDRWPIEIYIRNCKSYLGMNGYQIRNSLGVKRYLIAIMIAYSYIVSRNKKHNFSKNFRAAQNNVKYNTIEYIYSLGVDKVKFSEVLKTFKIA